MKTEEPLSYVDDDIYWKNGWYNNPRDRRWVVPSRMCSSNYSFNMGKPGVALSDRSTGDRGDRASAFCGWLLCFSGWILSVRSYL